MLKKRLISQIRNFFSFSTDKYCNILVKKFVDSYSENSSKHVMSSIIDKAPTLDDCTTANIKLNKVGEIIEKEELHWPEYKNSDSKREYHSMVRGLILNEVIRRIDPQVHKTKHIADALLNLDIQKHTQFSSLGHLLFFLYYNYLNI